MAIEITVDTPVLKGEKGDKGDTGSFDYGHLEDIVIEHLDNRFENVDANLDLKVDKEEGKSLIDDEYIQKLDKLDTLDKTVVEKFNDKVEQSDLEENLNTMEGSLQNYIDEKLVTAGSGDMLKSVYDTNNDGVVDLASQADNADTVNNLTVETAVPENAVFTDTTYDLVSNDENGLMSSADKIKLDGIARGATRVDVVDSLESTETDKALSANQGKTLKTSLNETLSRVAVLEDKTQPVLFEGAIKTGTFTLAENVYNFRMLVFFINSAEDGIPFGNGILPVLSSSPSAQTVIFSDTTALNSHSTYMGKIVRTSALDKLQIAEVISNVSHKSGSNHTGGSTYFIRKVIGIR